jgi:hypothetical protein
MTESVPPRERDTKRRRLTAGLGRLGPDGWANTLVGVLTVLAIADLLPKIPW